MRVPAGELLDRVPRGRERLLRQARREQELAAVEVRDRAGQPVREALRLHAVEHLEGARQLAEPALRPAEVVARLARVRALAEPVEEHRGALELARRVGELAAVGAHEAEVVARPRLAERIVVAERHADRGREVALGLHEPSGAQERVAALHRRVAAQRALEVVRRDVDRAQRVRRAAGVEEPEREAEARLARVAPVPAALGDAHGRPQVAQAVGDGALVDGREPDGAQGDALGRAIAVRARLAGDPLAAAPGPRRRVADLGEDACGVALERRRAARCRAFFGARFHRLLSAAYDRPPWLLREGDRDRRHAAWRRRAPTTTPSSTAAPARSPGATTSRCCPTGRSSTAAA